MCNDFGVPRCVELVACWLERFAWGRMLREFKLFVFPVRALLTASIPSLESQGPVVCQLVTNP